MPTKARGYWFCEFCSASFDTSDEAEDHELYECRASNRRRQPPTRQSAPPPTLLQQAGRGVVPYIPPPYPPTAATGVGVMPPYSVYPPEQQQHQPRSYTPPLHGQRQYYPPPNVALPPSPPYEFDIIKSSSPPTTATTTRASYLGGGGLAPATTSGHRASSVSQQHQQQQQQQQQQHSQRSSRRSTRSRSQQVYYLWNDDEEQQSSPSRDRLSSADTIACQHVELVELLLSRTTTAGAERGDDNNEGEDSGRNSSSTDMYQIGLRCKHCGNRGVTSTSTGTGEVTLPRSISNLPDALRTWVYRHLLQQNCPYVTTTERDVLIRSANEREQQQQQSSSPSERERQYRQSLLEYCAQKCREYGMIDRQPSGIVLARSADDRGRDDDVEVEDTAEREASTTTSAVAAASAEQRRRRPAVADNEEEEEPPSYYERPSELSQPQYRRGDRYSPPPSPPPPSMYWEQQQPGFYQNPLSSSSPPPLTFPFFQDADGDWICKYCSHIHPQYRDAHCRWSQSAQPPSSASASSSRTTSPPPPDFIDLHLHYCRAYHHHLQVLQQHRQQQQSHSMDFGPPAPASAPPHLYSFHAPTSSSTASATPGATTMYTSPPRQYPQASFPPPRQHVSSASSSSHHQRHPVASWETAPSTTRRSRGATSSRPSHGSTSETPYVLPQPPPSSAPGRMEATLLMPAPTSPLQLAPLTSSGAAAMPASASSMGRLQRSAELDRSAQRAIEFLKSTEKSRTSKATMGDIRKSEALSASDRLFLTGPGPSGAEAGPLVREEDKLLLTDFLFHLMKQLQIVRFSESDRKTRGGKREKIQLGFGGLECIHCTNSAKSRKFFWSGVDRLANSFAEIPAHVFKCTSCPDDVKDALTHLKQVHAEQMARLPRGSQKVFFRRVWKRLHEGDPVEPQGYEEASPMAYHPHTSSPEDSKLSPSQLQQHQQQSPEGTSGSEESIFTLQRPTKDAAKALADASVQAGPPSPSSRVLLGIVEDRDFLSDVDCLIRRQIEVFCATKDDVRVAQDDRKYPIHEGQIGIRCVHCSMARNGRGASGHAVAYPFSISAIFEAVREFQRLHLDYCENLPLSIRSKVSEMKESATITSIQRKYYTLAAKGLGLRDTKDGIRAGSESVAVVSQAVFAFASETTSPETSSAMVQGGDEPPSDDLADYAARGSPLSESGTSLELFGSEGRKRRREGDDASLTEPSTKKRYPFSHHHGSGGDDHSFGHGPHAEI